MPVPLWQPPVVGAREPRAEPRAAAALINAAAGLVMLERSLYSRDIKY